MRPFRFFPHFTKLSITLVIGTKLLFGQSVKITWSPDSDAGISQYNIYRTIHRDSVFKLIGTVPYPSTFYVDKTIDYNKHYVYTATTVNLDDRESDFSNIVEINTSGVNPVELAEFTYFIQQNNIILTWITASESNNYGFEIQRNLNNRNYQTIGFVKGHGTCFMENVYTFVDSNLKGDIYYYRLKQLDFSGDFTYSEQITISLESRAELTLYQNYPNPFNTSTRITYNLQEAGMVHLDIYDINGRKVSQLVNGYQDNGFHTVNWDGMNTNGINVASGTYFIKLCTTSDQFFRRLVLSR